MGTDDPDDVDRAAILARRQRFIVLALSGLASACTSNERPARPQACLKYSIEPREKNGGTKPVDPREPSDTAQPVPCLEVMPPRVDPVETPPVEDPKATPQPCLSPLPGPPPTLPRERKADTKPAKPVPCLEIMPPRDDEK